MDFLLLGIAPPDRRDGDDESAALRATRGTVCGPRAVGQSLPRM